MLGRGLRAMRLGIARVTLISLASEAWTLLSDDLSLVIFKQSTTTSNPDHTHPLSPAAFPILFHLQQHTIDLTFGRSSSPCRDSSQSPWTHLHANAAPCLRLLSLLACCRTPELLPSLDSTPTLPANTAMSSPLPATVGALPSSSRPPLTRRKPPLGRSSSLPLCA